MNPNQELKNKIDAVKRLLETQANGDELKTALLPSFDEFVKRWNQCDRMTSIENYQTLTAEIKKKITGDNTWFYIGYTNRPLTSLYLWDKSPQNSPFLQHDLVKRHTYYTHLQGKTGESEDNFIKEFVHYERCLNVDDYGEHKTDGIVYVLVYGEN